MAEITATRSGAKQEGVELITWEAMGDDDTGTSMALSNAPDKTVQVTGSLGGATVTVQGSNDDTNWETLTDTTNTDIALTAEGMVVITENPLFIRAITAGGTSTDVDVTIAAKR